MLSPYPNFNSKDIYKCKGCKRYAKIWDGSSYEMKYSKSESVKARKHWSSLQGSIYQAWCDDYKHSCSYQWGSILDDTKFKVQAVMVGSRKSISRRRHYLHQVGLWAYLQVGLSWWCPLGLGNLLWVAPFPMTSGFTLLSPWLSALMHDTLDLWAKINQFSKWFYLCIFILSREKRKQKKKKP